MRTGLGDGPCVACDEPVPMDDETVGDIPNADDPCDDDERSSAEERRRNSGGWGAVLGRGTACVSARAGAGEDPGTVSVGKPEGGPWACLTNSEDDRGRPRPGGTLLGFSEFERAGETGDIGEMCGRIGWDCEMGIGETGEDVAGVSLGKADDDDVRGGGVPAGEAVIEPLTPSGGENCAIDEEGR